MVKMRCVTIVLSASGSAVWSCCFGVQTLSAKTTLSRQPERMFPPESRLPPRLSISCLMWTLALAFSVKTAPGKEVRQEHLRLRSPLGWGTSVDLRTLRLTTENAMKAADLTRTTSTGFQARSKDQEILEEGGGAGPSLLPRRDHE